MGKRFLHKKAQRELKATVPNIFVAREEHPCSTSFRGRPDAVFRVTYTNIVIHNDNISIGKKEVYVKEACRHVGRGRHLAGLLMGAGAIKRRRGKRGSYDMLGLRSTTKRP